MNIHQINKLAGILSIKNEPTNIYRILEGILEIHIFFVSGCKTNICSFVNEWNIIDYLQHCFFVKCLDLGFILLHYIYIIRHILKNSKENLGYFFPSLKLLKEGPWLHHNFYVVPQ